MVISSRDIGVCDSVVAGFPSFGRAAKVSALSVSLADLLAVTGALSADVILLSTSGIVAGDDTIILVTVLENKALVEASNRSGVNLFFMPS